MKQFVLAVAVALAAVAASASPETFVIDRPHSEADFAVRHMMSRVTGKFADFGGAITLDRANPAASSVEFRIKTASVDTGAPDRDKHLRTADFFDAEKYPEITFKSTSVKAGKEKNHFDVTGDLTMRGVTRRVTLPVEFLGFAKDPWGAERAGFALETKLNRKDYGINWNKALDNGGFLVGDDVTVNINLEALPKK